MSLLEPLSLLSTLLCLIIAGLCWARRTQWGALELMRLVLAIAWWTFCVLLITVSPGLSEKTTWFTLTYLGIVSVPPLFLAFVARVTLDPVGLRRRTLWLMWLIPCVTLLLAFTDGRHSLMFGPITLSLKAPGYITYPGGVWWWVHTLYSYLLLLAGVALLARAWRQHQGVYRLQLSFWLGAICLPFAVNFAQLFDLGPLPGIDLTPASLTLTGIIVFFGLSRRQLLVIQPVALEVALESLMDGVLVLDADLNLMHLNAATRRQLSVDYRGAIGERAASGLLAWSALEAAFQGVGAGVRTLHHTLEDSEYEYQITPILQRGGRPSGYLLLARDVTEVRRYQRHVQDLAFQDSLTGLSNRRALFRVGRERLERALEHGESSALLYVDLDRFKAVNDALGHEVGDTLLVRVAERLRAQVKLEDLVSRNGGDEFTVLLETISRTHAQEVARRLEVALGQPYRLGAHEVVIGASIGVAMFPEDAVNIEELLHQADLKMYLVKTRNKAVDVQV